MHILAHFLFILDQNGNYERTEDVKVVCAENEFDQVIFPPETFE